MDGCSHVKSENDCSLKISHQKSTFQMYFKNPVNKNGILPPINKKLKENKNLKSKPKLLVHSHEIDLKNLSINFDEVLSFFLIYYHKPFSL